MQKTLNENADAMMGSFGAITKGTQAITTEIADYSRRSFENGTKTMESLLSAKSLNKAVQVQSEYAKSAYEGLYLHRRGQRVFNPYETLSRK